MSLRRFLNVVENRRGCIYSLHRINLARQDLFYPTPPPPPPNGNNRSRSGPSLADIEMMESIRLPAPTIEFQPTPFLGDTAIGGKMDCFPLSESKIICTDQSARAFLYDADLRRFQTMPSLHTRKREPISFSIPGADEQDDGRLYVMEKVPKPQKTPDICQFEAFAYRIPKRSCSKPIWHCLSLPLPPYVSYHSPGIDSYAVLGGGSHLCISTAGIGTFCFDTVSCTWREAGDWELPFYGKAEYIPELNIWFGQSAGGNNLCVSDLSSVLKGRKPGSCNVSRVRDPPEWETFKETELISLGSGRFCIAKFINDTRDREINDFYVNVVVRSYVLFTGVEVVPSGDQDKPSGNGNGSGSGNDSGSGSGSANGSGSGNANGSGSGSNDSGTGNANGSGCGNGNGSGNGNGNGKGKGKRRFRMIEHKSKRSVLVGCKTIESVF